jgi:hypothetical protein
MTRIILAVIVLEWVGLAVWLALRYWSDHAPRRTYETEAQRQWRLWNDARQAGALAQLDALIERQKEDHA